MLNQVLSDEKIYLGFFRKGKGDNMEAELRVFNSAEFMEIRVIEIKDKPYFVGEDVALALGYTDTANAVLQHCKGILKQGYLTKGGNQKIDVIPESDIYRLIANSQLPSAEEFEKWVFDEVLPAKFILRNPRTRKNCKDMIMDANNPLIKQLGNSPRESDRLACAILLGSDREALNILACAGNPRVIPATYYTSIIEMARYYGVTEDYLRSVLSRWGITAKKMPEYVIHNDIYGFLKDSGISKRVDVYRGRDNYNTLYDKETRRYCADVIDTSRSQSFYSARAFLALSALMYQGRVVASDNQASKVFSVLKKSSYAMDAEELLKRNSLKNTENKEISAESSETTEVRISEISLSATPEALHSIISKSVSEIIASILEAAR